MIFCCWYLYVIRIFCCLYFHSSLDYYTLHAVSYLKSYRPIASTLLGIGGFPNNSYAETPGSFERKRGGYENNGYFSSACIYYSYRRLCINLHVFLSHVPLMIYYREYFLFYKHVINCYFMLLIFSLSSSKLNNIFSIS